MKAMAIIAVTIPTKRAAIMTLDAFITVMG
jgi:hypothetical protein